MKRNNLIILGVFLLVLFGMFIIYDKLPSSKETITANGIANIKATPDKASTYVRIESLKNTAEAAKNDNDAKSNAVMTALKKLDVKIETSQYNMYPEYDWTNGQKLIGYKVMNVLKVSTDYFDDLGVIVDAAVKAGGLIDNINFELSPARESEFKKKALEEAGKDAKEKAEAIAAGMGVKLGRLVSVSSSDFYYRPYPLYEKGMGVAVAETVRTIIEPQELEVSANINVVYNIR